MELNTSKALPLDAKTLCAVSMSQIDKGEFVASYIKSQNMFAKAKAQHGSSEQASKASPASRIPLVAPQEETGFATPVMKARTLTRESRKSTCNPLPFSFAEFDQRNMHRTDGLNRTSDERRKENEGHQQSHSLDPDYKMKHTTRKDKQATKLRMVRPKISESTEDEQEASTLC
jgi:hypothetical protein